MKMLHGEKENEGNGIENMIGEKKRKERKKEKEKKKKKIIKDNYEDGECLGHA